jgi:hypothetical protein
VDCIVKKDNNIKGTKKIPYWLIHKTGQGGAQISTV